jgi:hypothetical protein
VPAHVFWDLTPLPKGCILFSHCLFAHRCR